MSTSGEKPPIQTIERAELHQKLARGDRFRLVNSLGDWEFRAKRIPGSVRFETPEMMFAALQKDDDIVVYCSNPACRASVNVYYKLVDRGYAHVRRYAGGIADWEDAGLPLEGEWVGRR